MVVVLLFPKIRSIGSILFVHNNIQGFHFGGSFFFEIKRIMEWKKSKLK